MDLLGRDNWTAGWEGLSDGGGAMEGGLTVVEAVEDEATFRCGFLVAGLVRLGPFLPLFLSAGGLELSREGRVRVLAGAAVFRGIVGSSRKTAVDELATERLL